MMVARNYLSVAGVIAILKPNRHAIQMVRSLRGDWRSCAHDHGFFALDFVQDPEDAWEINA